MSELDAIKQHLAAASAGIQAAVVACVDAGSTLRNKSEEFAGLGLEGIASVLNFARHSMERATTLVTRAHDASDLAVAELRHVTDKAGIADVRGALSNVIMKVDDGSRGLNEGAAEVDSAASVATGSEVVRAADACSTASTAITQAKTLIDSAHIRATAYRQTIDAAVKAAGATGASSAPSDAKPVTAAVDEPSATSRGHAPPQSTSAAPEATADKPRDVSYDPTKAKALHDKVGLAGCYAQVFDDQGNALTDVYRARDDTLVPDLDNITEDKRYGYSVTWHAEAHAASKMRTETDRDVVIYQTKPMCEYDNGCRTNLKHVIPADRSLYIKQTRGPNRAPKERRVEGTGEWLR